MMRTQHTENRQQLQKHDFGGNGFYLVFRQLQQDAAGFTQFLHDKAGGDSEQAENLGALMVGRHRNGDALVQPATRDIPGTPRSRENNHFDYDADPEGLKCPVSSHIRRSNPRTGDFAPGVTGLFSRLVRMLGFKRKSDYEDMVASSRFHRVLRRGRTYGMEASSQLQAQSNEKPGAAHECGLQFICVTASIRRQFEFVQSAWSVSSAFAGTRDQQDPLLGHGKPRLNGTRTDSFMHATKDGPQNKIEGLPQFVTVRGGGYFFMPGLRAIQYLAQIAQRTTAESDTSENSTQ